MTYGRETRDTKKAVRERVKVCLEHFCTSNVNVIETKRNFDNEEICDIETKRTGFVQDSKCHNIEAKRSDLVRKSACRKKTNQKEKRGRQRNEGEQEKRERERRGGEGERERERKKER